MSHITQILAAVLLVQVSCAFGGKISPRIIGGKDAYPGEYPYQVSIQYGVPPLVKPKPVCGGSILNDRWVLTSAGCLTLIPKIGKVIVKAGLHELDKDSEYVQTSDVQLRLVHKDYKGLLERIKPYDIGLLKLKTPLLLNERVQAVKLPQAYELPDGKAVLTGWGSVSKNVVPKLPKVLQTVEVPIITENNCEDALRTISPSAKITDIQFCTGPLDENVSACAGDWGDPLVQVEEEDGAPVQVGIASWAHYPCGSTGAPTVYTLVSAFVYWIEDRIQENS